MQDLIPDPKRWAALALLCAAQFIVILDTSIIGVALPAMQADLGFSASGLSWIFNAYVIAFGGLLLLGGRLGDLLGARRIFAGGFAILTLASLLAGLAPSQELLLAGRALQGVGAALIAPSALTILMRLFGHDGTELGKAFGFWGAAAAAGGSAGVFLGGVITEWMSWNWTFLINVPLGLLVLALVPAVLDKSPRSSGGIDWFGAISVTSALVSLVYAIVSIEAAGSDPSQTLSILVASGILFAIFVIAQFARREPLLPLGIFKAPNLAAGNLVMALLGAAWIPLWFFLNLYLQQILGLSALASGLALLPMTVTIMIVMVGFSGKLIARFGAKSNLVLGLLLMGGALWMFPQLPLDGTFVFDVLPASLLAAFGMALAYIPTTMTGMAGARPEETGLASGLINTTYQIGSAIGLAVMVMLSTEPARPPKRCWRASSRPSSEQPSPPVSRPSRRCCLLDPPDRKRRYRSAENFRSAEAEFPLTWHRESAGLAGWHETDPVCGNPETVFSQRATNGQMRPPGDQGADGRKSSGCGDRCFRARRPLHRIERV